jgi:hypothetical protein
MADWSTAASLATAVGTLVLACATFVAVRAANRAARVAEYSMQIGIRPLLMPSRLEDPIQKIMWGDERIFGMELLYSDHEGGQHAIGRFALAPIADSRWLCSVVRHWNLDRPNPRDR